MSLWRDRAGGDRRRQTPRRGLRRLLLIFLLLGMPLAFDLGFFVAGLLPEPRTPAEVPSVDLIVVLTGGQGRFKEAAQFLLSGKGRFLLISGTEPKTQRIDILRANGLGSLSSDLSSKILLGDESRNTFENAQEIRKVAERLRVHRLLLVTSNYHMRRAMRLVEAEFKRKPVYQAEVYAYPVESPNFAPQDWWQGITGWHILLQEYFKSLSEKSPLPLRAQHSP